MGFVTGDPESPERVPLLEDLPDPSGKAVLLRATFDRPLSADKTQPLARRRAEGLADTVTWLVAHGAGVSVCGNTEGSDGVENASRLDDARRAVEALSTRQLPDSVVFTPSPEDPEAVGGLVEEHDLFVNDTLQDSYLPMPSLTLPAQRLPSAVGRTLQRDLEILDGLLFDPARPFVAILGGGRSVERLRGLQGLVLRADSVLAGGALALPLLQALGRQRADDPTDAFLWDCRNVLGLSRRVRHEILLPSDLVWRKRDGSVAVTEVTESGGDDVVDVGPITRIRFAEEIEAARTVVWAGALGHVEEPAFAKGTEAIAGALSDRISVVLGGDALVGTLASDDLLPPSAAVLSATDAAIELLKNGDLPALSALRRRRAEEPSP